jgi:hypothetical protein
MLRDLLNYASNDVDHTNLKMEIYREDKKINHLTLVSKLKLVIYI